MTKYYDLTELSLRLTNLRRELLISFPFFGRLLFHLKFSFALCGTAYTDMEKIVIDPGFMSRISDAEVRFVLLHEVLHCALHHCTRARYAENRQIYNLACDIVVNSFVLELFHVRSFCVDGEPVVHLAPDGREGRKYTAEEIYDMLDWASEETTGADAAAGFDAHEVWDQIETAIADDIWERHVREEAKAVGIAPNAAGDFSGIPRGLERYLRETKQALPLDWRQLLQDFIQPGRSDFTYDYPDHRYQGDVIMPSFQENIYGERTDKLWFFIDTSGSISDEGLSEAYSQIKMALEQIDSITGELAFFDTRVSVFFPISSEAVLNVKPVGGGTSFHAIFTELQKRKADQEQPSAIVILTDGYADFPPEEAAQGVPVLWVIINSDVEPPWGVSKSVKL